MQFTILLLYETQLFLKEPKVSLGMPISCCGEDSIKEMNIWPTF